MVDLGETRVVSWSSSDSIAVHVEALATRDELPLRAARACVERLEEARPSLHAAIEKVIVGGDLTDDDDTLFVRSLFILATARDAASCPLFDRLVRRPSHVVDDVLGDLVTEELPRLLASVFDGDAAALLGLVGDRNVDEYVRGAALGAATFLTAEGRIARDEMQAALRRVHELRHSEPSEFLWMSWVDAVGLLGLRDLIPLAEQAFADGTIDPKLADRALLDRDLDAAERDDPNRFADRFLGYVGDLAGQVDWCRHARFWTEGESAPSETIINPHRDVGRNDPCPCGSGKKFKKCCLAA